MRMTINSIYISKLAILNNLLVAKSDKLSEGIIKRYVQAFEQICSDKALTAKELCQSLDIWEATITGLKNGTYKSLKADLIVGLCLKYDYSILWMMAGQGEMRTDNKTRNIEQEIAHIKEILGSIIVPLLNEVIGVEIKVPGKAKGNLDALLKNISKS